MLIQAQRKRWFVNKLYYHFRHQSFPKLKLLVKLAKLFLSCSYFLCSIAKLWHSWNFLFTQTSSTLSFVLDIYRLMLSDNKKYGLSVNLMATRVMPSLLPQTVNPRLHLEQFSMLLAVLQEMLEHIDRLMIKSFKQDGNVTR